MEDWAAGFREMVCFGCDYKFDRLQIIELILIVVSIHQIAVRFLEIRSSNFVLH